MDSDKTYFNDMILGTKNKDGNWVISDGKIAKGTDDMFNDIYPVVTLNGFVKYESGEGTSENPFIVSSSSKIGSYVKIMDDTYIVNEVNGGNLKLTLVGDRILVRKMYKDSFIDDLNLDFYNDLEYKNLLVKYKVGVSEYKDTYTDCNKDKKEVYVGYPEISDLKLDNDVKDYYLINSGEEIYYYNNGTKIGNKNLSMKVQPVIMIKSSKISSGSGSITDPYVVEVK